MYVHSWTPVYREATGLQVSIAKMLSLLMRTPNVFIVEGVTVFGCFPRFLALLQVLYFFVCGVDYHDVFQLCETEDTLPLTAKEELLGNRQLLV